MTLMKVEEEKEEEYVFAGEVEHRMKVEEATRVERKEERMVLDPAEVAAVQCRNPFVVLLDSLHNLHTAEDTRVGERRQALHTRRNALRCYTPASCTGRLF